MSRDQVLLEMSRRELIDLGVLLDGVGEAYELKELRDRVWEKIRDTR